MALGRTNDASLRYRLVSELLVLPDGISLRLSPPFGHDHMVRYGVPEVPNGKSVEYKESETRGCKSSAKLLPRITFRSPPPFDEDPCNPVLSCNYHEKSSVPSKSSIER